MEDERNTLKLEKYKPNTSKNMRNSMDDLFKTRDSGFKPLSRNKLFNSTRNLSVTSNLIKSQSHFNRTVKLKLLKLSSSVRCWGMSDLHSANTLQNSIYSWSFGKANRFEGVYMIMILRCIERNVVMCFTICLKLRQIGYLHLELEEGVNWWSKQVKILLHLIHIRS